MYVNKHLQNFTNIYGHLYRRKKMQGNCILEMTDIEKRFEGTHALKGVSAALRKGEIHALVGENGAGKSTLMNIVSGVIRPDAGKMYMAGKEVHFSCPNEAQAAGIGFVHQELALCHDLSVGNNIFISHLPNKHGFVNTEVLNRKSREIIGKFGKSGQGIDPAAPVSSLSVAQQQIVEIAKALSMDCRVLIFDEPTSSLNEEEAAELFAVIKKLAAGGMAVFYISHKMDEIFSQCDVITILRDGSLIETVRVSDVSSEYVVSKMVGRELGSLYPGKSVNRGEEMLRVEDLSRSPKFRGISFSTYKKEILGLCGLVGAGRSEIARAVCGIDRIDRGRILLEGRQVNVRSCKEAANAGICYLTEDRKADGLFLDMSLSENMIAPQLNRFSSHGFISGKKISDVLMYYKKLMRVKFSEPQQPMKSLSGGNQQKLMIAKIIAMHPKVVFLDEPTRGIDVGAKAEIHSLLRELSDKGISVVVISSEMPETVGICDRVVIINNGTKIGELSGKDLTQERIISKISAADEVMVKGGL